MEQKKYEVWECMLSQDRTTGEIKYFKEYGKLIGTREMTPTEAGVINDLNLCEKNVGWPTQVLIPVQSD